MDHLNLDKFGNWLDEQGGPLEDMVDSGASMHLFDPCRKVSDVSNGQHNCKLQTVPQWRRIVSSFMSKPLAKTAHSSLRGAPSFLSIGNLVLREENPFEFHWDQRVNDKGAITPYIV